ncbi:DUF2628 domain-containing protein [Metabacillus sp. RGM 3146]|uniref:DUF2628 domain-containing protein n=1 Tax=Metabacillus sp. RGM 3146 TaxID=3401092 RepID=UPI003B991FE8
MYCKRCGELLSSDVNFCPSCGAPKESYESESLVPIERSENEELSLFVGKKADVYHRKWGKATNKAGWNWAAFFLGIFWLGYRKMYRFLLIFLGIYLLVDLITWPFYLFLDPVTMDKVSPLIDLLNYVIGIASSVTLGIYGNYFYYKHAKEKINNIKQKFPNHPDIQAYEITKRGGTSWGTFFILLAAAILYAIVIVGIIIFITFQDTEYPGETSSVNENSSIADDFSQNSSIDNWGGSAGDSETSIQTIDEVLQDYMKENKLALTAEDVQYDMENNLDEDFAIAGTAKLDTYYNYGFADASKENFSVSINPVDGGEPWNLYFDRKDFADLYTELKNQGEVDLVATGIIPSEIYDPAQGNMAFAEQVTWDSNE